MDVLAFETCWAVNSEIIKQVTSSWSIFIQLWLLVNASHAVAHTVSWLQSVQLSPFPYLRTILSLRFHVFTMVSSQIPFYWVLTPCSLVRRHPNSGVIWNLKMEIARCSNTSLPTSKTTQNTAIWNSLHSAFYLTIEISDAVYCKKNSNPDTDDAVLVLGM